MFRVYKITNKINNKIYFGYTSQTLTKRLQGHYAEPRNTIISRALRKYGYEHFIIEDQALCETEDVAKQKEIQLIAENKTNALRFPHGNGMNMTDGGEGARGYRHSIALRERWSEQRKGIKPIEAIKQRVKQRQRTVYQFSLSGQPLCSFPSIKDASKATGIDAANISWCCKGRIARLRGYIFQYTKRFSPRNTTPKNHTKIVQLNNEGQIIGSFDSIEKAARAIGRSRSGIDKCLMGVSNRCGGFMWRRG